MDHYPGLDQFRLKDEPLRPAQWLCFDHGDHEPCAFQDYPLVRGWTADQVQALRTQDPKDPFTIPSLALIQSWMFLGALEALTDRHISETDFLRRKFKRPVVHTGFLTSYLVEWIRGMKTKDETSQKDIAALLNDVLTDIQSWCYKLSTSTPASIPTINNIAAAGEVTFAATEVDSVVRLITLVGETICTASHHLSRALTTETRGFVGCYTPNETARLVTRLAKRGWCPYMARMLFTYRYSVAEYAAFYPRPRLSSMPSTSHQNAGCTQSQCVAYDVVTETYVTRHTSAACDCSFMWPPLDETLELLRQGKVPVIFLTTSDPAGPRLGVACSELSELNEGKGYLAFSHVWSDGLGSNTESGLPRCVVNNLFQQARAYGHDYIWIDSLCVPSDSHRSDRKRAIQLMAKTYENASLTVVLDSSIRTVTFDLSPEGIALTLLRLVTSVWCQRLWTLQEARLSKVLIFQFHNTMATAVDVWLGFVKTSNEHWHVNPVTQILAREFWRLMRPSSQGLIGDRLELGELSSMLHRRRTSRLIDETVAVAGLVDVDVAYLMEGSTSEERMKRFFISLRKIPSDIVMSPLPRLSAPGFRWTPASFMSHGDNDRRWSLSTGTRVQWAESDPGGGLHGRYRLTKLSKTVWMSRNATSILINVEHKTLQILYLPPTSTSLGGEDLDFDTIATIPALERNSVMGHQLGAALLATSSEEAKSGVRAYEYKGRVLVKDMTNFPWRTATIRDDIASWVEEDGKILIT